MFNAQKDIFTSVIPTGKRSFYLAREAGQNLYVMNSRVPDNPFFAFFFIYLHILSSSTCVTLQLVFDSRKKPQTFCIDFCLL